MYIPQFLLNNDQTHEVKKGDAIFIPANATHGIENIGEEVLTYLTANKASGKEREATLWLDKIDL